MYNPYSLEGKTILITGASSGIGRATAIECSKLGATVILAARNEEKLKETLSLLEGKNHMLFCCDFQDYDQINNLVDSIPAVQGLVNNAGINKLIPISFIKETDLMSIFNVNTIGPILLLKELLKKKKLKKCSSVVFTSSIAAMGSTAVGEAIYTASKGAISSFVKEAAQELSKKQIRVNAVCPGMVKTEMSDAYDLNDGDNDDMKNYPLGRYATPEEISWAIIYLLSEASAWVTGTNLIIDGGLTTK